MILVQHSISVSGQATVGPLSLKESSAAFFPAVRPPAVASERTRAGIRDMDRAKCRTRLSQRRFLIQLQSDSGGDFRSELQRYRESLSNNQWSARVVDWD